MTGAAPDDEAKARIGEVAEIVLGIPDRAKFGDIDRAAHGLKERPCAERHGMSDPNLPKPVM